MNSFFKQKIFIASFLTLMIVGLFQYLGCKYDTYYFYPSFDIPMHILGGLWTSLFALSFILHLNLFNKDKKKIFYLILAILFFVIVSWEIFEFTTKITALSDDGYWLDTWGDVLNGFIGGIFGYYYFVWKKNLSIVS